MARRFRKPLTDGELFPLLENDSDSDLPDLSDEDDQPWPLSEDLDRQQNIQNMDDAFFEFMEDRDIENQQEIDENNEEMLRSIEFREKNMRRARMMKKAGGMKWMELNASTVR